MAMLDNVDENKLRQHVHSRVIRFFRRRQCSPPGKSSKSLCLFFSDRILVYLIFFHGVFSIFDIATTNLIDVIVLHLSSGLLDNLTKITLLPYFILLSVCSTELMIFTCLPFYMCFQFHICYNVFHCYTQ